MTHITVLLHRTSASQTATINNIAKSNTDTLVIASTSLTLLVIFFDFVFGRGFSKTVPSLSHSQATESAAINITHSPSSFPVVKSV